LPLCPFLTYFDLSTLKGPVAFSTLPSILTLYNLHPTELKHVNREGRKCPSLYCTSQMKVCAFTGLISCNPIPHFSEGKCLDPSKLVRLLREQYGPSNFRIDVSAPTRQPEKFGISTDAQFH
jgi:hypothetical protein